MRRAELWLVALLVPLDAAFVLLGGSLAYFLRAEELIRSIPSVSLAELIPFGLYLRFLLIALPLLLVTYVAYGLYSPTILRRRFIEELARLGLATTTALMLVTFLLFFTQIFDISRLIILLGWLSVLILVGLGRLLFRLLRLYLYVHGVGNRRVLIIGLSPLAIRLVTLMLRERLLGYQPVGLVRTQRGLSRRGLPTGQAGLPESVEVVGPVEALWSILEQYPADELVVTDQKLRHSLMLELVEWAHRRGVTIRYVPDLFEVTTHNAEVSSLATIPLITLKGTPLDGWGRILKRGFDLVCSFILIVVLSPLMLLIGLLIRLVSRIPILFAEYDDGRPMLRIGQFGEPFRHFKFRTMYPGTHGLRYTTLKHLSSRSGPLPKLQGDPRITPLGRWLRRYSLDELPELLLVLAGTMSLVGPRPHLPEEVARYRKAERRVLDLKPGMTGLAQVSGRSDLSFDEEVRLDSFYIEHWSLLLDVAILFRTVGVVLFRGYRE